MWPSNGLSSISLRTKYAKTAPTVPKWEALFREAGCSGWDLLRWCRWATLRWTYLGGVQSVSLRSRFEPGVSVAQSDR